MRILVVLILLAFSLVTEGKTQRLNDAKTQSKDSATLCLCDSASYYESQIRKADSLYKNYLPQSNFEEVKAAVEFFDSYQRSAISGQRWRFFDSYQPSAISGQRWRLFGKEADDGNRLIAESRQLTAAKAHYYHAVGLTERDDIVGACEHYLIALEIMEPLVETSPLWRLNIEDKTKTSPLWRLMANDKSLKTKGKSLCDSATLRLCDSKGKGKSLCDSNKEDCEKIRFIALIYNRLGRLFYNENYCDLAILKYKKALKYVDLINDNSYRANLLKELGNSYQFINNADSALYYYKESLNTSSDQYNKFDVEKCIAQVLYNKGEKDSAYMILKSNLRKININNVKYSYHYTIGNMLYNDKSYDSAIYYLEKSLDDYIITKKLAFTTKLSAIYDSLGDYEKKAYYDNLSSNLFKNNYNKEIDKFQLQTLYNNYNQRKADKEITTAKMKARNKTIAISIIVLVVVTFVIIYIRYNHKKQNDKLKKEIDGYASDIDNKDIIISQKEQLVGEYKKAIEKKDEIIKKQSNEIQNYIYEKEQVTTMDFESYYNCNICKKILNEKEERYTVLSAADLSLLVDSANENLNNILKKLKELYPQLNNNDMYYICLSMLNISVNGTSYLMGRTRKTVWLRIKTIKSYMNLKDNDDLLAFLKTIR